MLAELSIYMLAIDVSFELIVAMTTQQVLGACAQPQYRVSVDPPIPVLGLPANVAADSVSIIVCFREADSTNGADLNHCPLGMITRRANSVDEPLQELALGEGAENLAPAYPTVQATMLGSSTTTVFLGVGLYVVVVDDSMTNAGSPSIQSNW